MENKPPRETALNAKIRQYQWSAPFILLILVVVCSIAYVSVASSSAHTTYSPLKGNYGPDVASFTSEDDINGYVSGPLWRVSDGDFKHLTGNADEGYIVAATDTTIKRLSSKDGSEGWVYGRSDAKVCDMDSFGTTVYAVFDPGNGCSDIIALDALSGQYVAQAQFGTKEKEAALTFGGGYVNVVTPSVTRVFDAEKLYPQATFGDDPAAHHKSSQDYENCSISDSMTSEEKLIVVAKCNDEENFFAYEIKTDQEDSYRGDVVHEYNLYTTEPVTLAAVTKKQFITVAQDSEAPAARIWDMESHNEVDSFSLQPANIGFEYQYKENIGYVIRIGDWVRIANSEDLTENTIDSRGATSDPIIVGDNVFFVTYDGIRYINTRSNDQYDIEAYILPRCTDTEISGNRFISLCDREVVSQKMSE